MSQETLLLLCWKKSVKLQQQSGHQWNVMMLQARLPAASLHMQQSLLHDLATSQ